MDTWVLVAWYKGNADAVEVLERAKRGLEAHIGHVTVAELMNVISHEFDEREARVQHALLKHSGLVFDGRVMRLRRTLACSRRNAGFLWLMGSF